MSIVVGYVEPPAIVSILTIVVQTLIPFMLIVMLTSFSITLAKKVM